MVVSKNILWATWTMILAMVGVGVDFRMGPGTNFPLMPNSVLLSSS